MTGGVALVETLIAAGARLAFGVPGESYLAVLEAMRRASGRFLFVPTRHESGASFAADACGKLTGRPGLCFVTRGPGATNAAIGVHTAAQDSTPLILFVGQVPRARLGHESFQEIDYQSMFGAIAKRVLVPDSARDLAAATAEAWALALSGRPGPVVVVLAEDVSEGEAVARAAAIPRAAAPIPDGAAIRRASALIAEARHPVIIAGGLVGHEEASALLATFAERIGAGVVAAWRRQGSIACDHAGYLGHFGIGRAEFQRRLWQECDLAIALGCRLDDITTEEGRLIRPDQTLIHVYPEPTVLARHGADVAIEAPVAPTLDALIRALEGRPPSADRLRWRARYHAEQIAFATPGNDPKVAPLGLLDMARIVETVGRRLGSGDVITNDAGNFAGWVQRYFPYRAARGQASPTSGAMGYAVPAALAAALLRPDRRAVAFVGDGGFMMTGQELSIAANLKLPLIVLVCDNEGFGTILMHQHQRYGPEHAFAVRLPSPDFALLGRAYRAKSFRIARTEEFEAAFDEALKAEGPSLLHLVQDPRDISAMGRLDL